LALFINLKLTTSQYNLLRQEALNEGVHLYPSYKKLIEAKKRCYPPSAEIVIEEFKVDIGLQSIVDLTTERFFKIQNSTLVHSVVENSLSDLEFIFKWGIDGCGSQRRYKQFSFSKVDDSSALVSSFVPIRLTGVTKDKEKQCLWQNPRTSSTKFCRPLRFRFVKETEEVLKSEVAIIKKQINELLPTNLEFGGIPLSVQAQFIETMVDGKVCNVLADKRSTQKCYICGATSKDMNQLDVVKSKKCEEQYFCWGLSTLHTYIRSMECLLHISYKLGIKKWQARSQEEKELVASRKKEIIDKFKNDTGLILDTPKQGGGNTNDGNSARRFFPNSSLKSNITGIDLHLIERFSIILQAISSGYDINNSAFEEYATKTAQLYVDLYGWYPMPPTVHKLLIHGPDIIKNFFIPIGQLSEEVQEARHKEFKRFREIYSRKTSRRATNEDILHCLLISSDPVISDLRSFNKHKKELPAAVKQLLIIENPINDSDDEVDDSKCSGSDTDFGVSDLSI